MKATASNDPDPRELKAVLAEHLDLAGRSGWLFWRSFCLALLKVRSVDLAELATGFGGAVRRWTSHYKRLQRFFRSL
jgi:hypothetical protein